MVGKAIFAALLDFMNSPPVGLRALLGLRDVAAVIDFPILSWVLGILCFPHSFCCLCSLCSPCLLCSPHSLCPTYFFSSRYSRCSRCSSFSPRSSNCGSHLSVSFDPRKPRCPPRTTVERRIFFDVMPKVSKRSSSRFTTVGFVAKTVFSLQC